jgi:hypothetical protein
MPEQPDALGPKTEEASLGEPIRVFRARLATSILIGVCSIITILLGVGCFFTDFATIGIYPVILGILVVGIAYLLQRRQCLVCPGGVINNRLGNRQWCRWEEIAEIVDQRVTRGIVSSRLCVLVRKKGPGMVMADLGISDFAALVDLLREQATVHNIPWKEEQIKK